MMKKQLLLLGIIVLLPFKLAAFTEYQLKAAFMYNVAKFVKWETPKPPAGNSDINLCILGEDPFEESIEVIKSKTIKQRHLSINNISQKSYLGNCHILFISKSEKNNLDAILKRAAGKSILTISDIDGFSDKGGMIGLAMEANKIKLEINLDNLKKEEIKVSAKLLEIAKTTKK